MRIPVARALRAGIVAALLTAGLGVATAQPASAASCPGSWYPNDNGDGSGIMKAGTWNLKGNYYSDCANVGTVDGGERVWFQCWSVNDYNNLWWYVRVAGTNKKGWISAANITAERMTDDNGDGVIADKMCYGL
ncbi:hypothetical protein Aca07nite_45180 [Actinoplanes capillaceus]|uniref:SH3 domain-containing protein n=1 Tax=Actinoplanes campanulatus TaxID=113559 RepID=A0ABQ3WLV9_9ACTN|nr:hypothetical protein [Actinoplanes capillaceus]GID47243.1 hypothetical protein Aca07nite_45180 [Actinoplanes capillaceus]